MLRISEGFGRSRTLAALLAKTTSKRMEENALGSIRSRQELGCDPQVAQVGVANASIVMVAKG